MKMKIPDPSQFGRAPHAAPAVLEQRHALEIAARPGEPIFDQAATAVVRRHRELLLAEPLVCENLLDDLLVGPAVPDPPHRVKRRPE
jgi:hypothetical protein